MKNKLIFFGFLTVLFLNGCEKLDLAVAVPKCIEKKIKEIQDQPVANPATQVWLWEYNGTKYYYFTAACCDQFSSLYDSNCDFVCAPDGGFSGGGDGNCIPGIQAATKTLIWKDPR